MSRAGLLALLPVVTLSLLVAPRIATATDWVGAGWGGANLVTASGDTVSGTFTQVGVFSVPAGAVVKVAAGLELEVHATEIRIDGTLDGSGAGNAGGAGAAVGANFGASGFGPGAGQGGLPGYCAHGGGGGGGGYGGPGGQGGYWFLPVTAIGGPTYGSSVDPATAQLGSGGGGSGSDCYNPSEVGGDGGGSITLVADIVRIGGSVLADGTAGDSHIGSFCGGGGGGSGGAIVIDAEEVRGTGALTARGGDGGDTIFLGGGWAGGGGGGGGGRIYVFSAFSANFTSSVGGGINGIDMYPLPLPSFGGLSGSFHAELTDPDVDGDGIDTGPDNCPTDPNPSQADDDGDGIGNACDLCPDDVTNDTDLDGACDSVDVCPLGDDNADADGDGVADACDACPYDSPDDTDNDGVCDTDDRCAGADDAIDEDEDGAPDLCDVCPVDYDPNQADRDGDGTGDACDCDPDDASANPSGVELCNGRDDDCDGEIDELGAEGGSMFWPDTDGDGQGDASAQPISGCAPPAGYAANALDCNDADRAVSAFATELCDGIDNDCDGQPEDGTGCGEGKDGGGDGGGCGCDGTGTGTGGAGALFAIGLAAIAGAGARRRRANRS